MKGAWSQGGQSELSVLDVRLRCGFTTRTPPWRATAVEEAPLEASHHQEQPLQHLHQHQQAHHPLELLGAAVVAVAATAVAGHELLVATARTPTPTTPTTSPKRKVAAAVAVALRDVVALQVPPLPLLLADAKVMATTRVALDGGDHAVQPQRDEPSPSPSQSRRPTHQHQHQHQHQHPQMPGASLQPWQHC